MRKTVRLTERDLSRIVRRVMNEGVVPVAELPISELLKKEGQTGTWRVQNGAIEIFDSKQVSMGQLANG